MQAEQLKDLIVNALEDVKAKDISVIDVRDRTSVTDFMVLASGTSNRHVKSLADSVDMGDVIVHVMLPAAREFYDLERFWRDAPDVGAAGSE